MTHPSHPNTKTPPEVGEALSRLAHNESFCVRLAPRIGDLLSQYPSPTNLTHLAAEVLNAVACVLPDSSDLPRPFCPNCSVASDIFYLKCKINTLVLLLDSIKENSLDINTNTDRLSEWLEGYSSFLSNIQHHAHSLDLQLDSKEG